MTTDGHRGEPLDPDAPAETLARLDHERPAERREAVRQTSGALTDTYPEGYLADLRADWPE